MKDSIAQDWKNWNASDWWKQKATEWLRIVDDVSDSKQSIWKRIPIQSRIRTLRRTMK